jgi:hypothetical protein
MARKRLGSLRPRYRFALNPLPEVRWSRCPRCDRLMHPRKFALVIGVAQAGMVALGKTCRYCTPCEFIIAHQEEVEAELAYLFSRKLPEAVGNEYLVVGTLDLKVWRKSLSEPVGWEEMSARMADIKHPMILHDPRRRWIRVDA